MNVQSDELSRAELLRRYGKSSPTPPTESVRRSPFKFLDSYDIHDADIFFGRDSETIELLQRFYSHGHMLIYGESGSGKSSLVQCGIRSRIPTADALFIPLRVNKIGLPTLIHQICAHTFHAVDELVEVPATASLTDVLREALDVASRPIVLFLDQFEELFIFHDAETRRVFAAQLASIETAKLNVKVIVGIRQDFLAHVSELEGTVAGLFDNRFWLRRMSRENAADAVVKACGTCDVKITSDLVRSIIDRIDTTGNGVELPYLQVVMDRLYHQAVQDNPAEPVITSSAVEKLGDVGRILASFLIEEVAKLPSPNVGRQILKAFVTREGTRRNLLRGAVALEAASFGDPIPPNTLATHLDQLVNVRVLRDVGGASELRHDALATTVSSWISEVEKELIEVRDNLNNRFKEYEARSQNESALLDQGFIDYLAVYRQRLAPLLDLPLRGYLETSQRYLVRRKRRAQSAMGLGALALLIVGIIGLTFYIVRINEEQTLAVRAEAKATAAAKRANQEASRANQEAERAKNELLRSRQLLYVNHIQTAQLEWETGNAASAWKHLLACDMDLREWEFDYLNSLFNRNHKTLRGHTGFVRAVTFDNDGSRVFSGSSDKTVKVWDAKTGKVKLTLGGHQGDVNDVAYSSVLNAVVSGSDDRTVRLWDADTGALINSMLGHTEFVAAVAFNPDGSRIASGSDDMTVKLWDANTQTLITTLHGHSDFVAAVTFSPDGRRIASGSDDTTIKLWDTASGDLIATFQDHTDRVNAVAFSPDGNRLVSASSDQSINIWDIASGTVTNKLLGHTSGIYSVEFDSDGQRVVSGCRDNTIRLWDANSGVEMTRLWAHTSTIYAVAFSPDGTQLLSGSRDNSLKLWELADAGSDRTSVLLQGHDDIVKSVAYSPVGNWFVSASGDKTLKMWNANDVSAKRTLVGHQDAVNAVAVSPDGCLVASGSSDKTIKLWNAETGEVLRTLKGHTGSVHAVCFSPDGGQIVSGSDDRMVKVWTTKTGEAIMTLTGHEGPVMAVAMSPDGNSIVSGGGRAQHFGELNLWDAHNGKLVKHCAGHTDQVACLDFSPDGRYIASGGFDNTLKLWNSDTMHEVFASTEHTDFVTAITFSSTGRQIATASRDNSMKIWNVSNGLETLTIKGHGSGVYGVAFSPDMTRLVSGSWDNTIRVWEAATVRP
jgi:WD40 repeat protein